MKNEQFTVINHEGREIICDLLFSFDSDLTGKSYIVYTDGFSDISGNTNVYASIYDPTQIDSRLLPIQTKEEWRMIETILGTLQHQIQSSVDEPDEVKAKLLDTEALTNKINRVLQK